MTNSLHAKSIVAIGDSLTAAYGIDQNHGWIQLLNNRLQEQGYDYQVINAGISGETSGNGLQRLPTVLAQYHPNIFIIGFGSNDGLRGLSPQVMEDNLSSMIQLAQSKMVKVLLLGFKVPTNYGPVYSSNFAAVFPKLATKFDVPLVPFLLEHVALVPELMLDDNLHPNAKAQPIILENVWPKLKPLLIQN